MSEGDTTATGEAQPHEGGTAPTRAERRRAEAQSSQREPRFTVDRLRSGEGHALVEGAYATNDEVAPNGAYVALLSGGLDDVDDEGLTRAEIRQRVQKFLAHEDTTGQEA
jgi:hypothetical protein